MHVILGASGQVGRRVAELLLEAGEQVAVVSRKAEHLADLVQRGAVPFVGSIEDCDFTLRAFNGAKNVFSMIPPNPYARDVRSFQTRAGASIAAAIAGSGVTHVVNLSSLGADLPSGTGLIVGLHEHEERLNAIPGLHVAHLRPGFFMENLLANIDLIKANGVNGTPIRGDLRMPVISAKDVGGAAAELLLELNFTDITVRELRGPRSLTLREMTRILGSALGMRALDYVQFTYEEAALAMTNQGVSADAARLYCEMCRAFNEGLIAGPGVGGESSSTSFEEFALEFAAAYRRGLETRKQEPEAASKR